MLSRNEKRQTVAEIRRCIASPDFVTIVHNNGLTSYEMSEMRRNVRNAGGHMRVVKNSLAKLAAEQTRRSEISEMLSGSSILMWSDDPISLATVINNTKKISIVGGFSHKAMDNSEIEAIPTLGSMDQQRLRMINALKSPAHRINTAIAH